MFEDFRPLYRVMLALGTAAVVTLAVGFVILLRYAPPGERTGERAHVVGIFPCNAACTSPSGPAATRFSRSQRFTAQVDWSSLPPDTVVEAAWTDPLDNTVGGVPSTLAGTLAYHGTLIPVSIPQQFHANLPGLYTLVVMRDSDGRQVELLARASVVVESGT